MLFQQAHAVDHHAAIDRFEHVVNGQQGHAGSGQGFHLDARAEHNIYYKNQ